MGRYQPQRAARLGKILPWLTLADQQWIHVRSEWKCDMRKPRTTPLTPREALDRIHFAEEVGDYLHVGRRLQWFNDLIVTSGNHEEKSELAAAQARYRQAEIHMAAHGTDSLLNHAHPFVQRLMRLREQVWGVKRHTH